MVTGRCRYTLQQALIGNRYGYQCFPSKIDAEEFETLQSYAEKQGAEEQLLSEWFWEDRNADPYNYVLQVNEADYRHTGNTTVLNYYNGFVEYDNCILIFLHYT